MTEKRFTTDNGSHEDVCLVDNLTKKEYESNFEDMVSLMNDIWNQTQRFEKHNQRLEKENEQLKQFQDRVFSWIDMHLQRLPTLIDDEFNSDNEFADPSLYSGALQILETMKNELKGDSE